MLPGRSSRPPAADRRIDNLERLAALLGGGALSREEFEREKRRILGDDADPTSRGFGVAARHQRSGVGNRRLVWSRVGWFIVGLALLALVVWITLASPDPRAAPVAAVAPDALVPDRGGEPSRANLLAGGWADERLGCMLGDKDGFDYFGADGRYGGWGGFGGYADEGRWALNGTTLVETITHHTGNNEASVPVRLPEPEVRTFAITSPAPSRMTVTGPSGGVARLMRCPDAHFAFSAKG